MSAAALALRSGKVVAKALWVHSVSECGSGYDFFYIYIHLKKQTYSNLIRFPSFSFSCGTD